MMISMGGNPFLVYIACLLGLEPVLFTTPAASMNAVIMHGNEHVDTKWAYGSGAIILVAGMSRYNACWLAIGFYLHAILNLKDASNRWRRFLFM